MSTGKSDNELKIERKIERTIESTIERTIERTIKASEFKAKCLKLMDQVAETGEGYVISKNGKPVARLLPYRSKPQSLFGMDRGKIEILGDVISPLPVEWEANEGRNSADEE